ncbi:MAG: M48 family metalloprotease [Deltaproteobacteria bacterium]|jgi:predicted Zn-dependent protease|nr:M48 family metalloprotease [Deltaproteobacteria bacterium]
MRKLAYLLLSIILIYGCAVNPVTGSRELSLISENQEISIGQKNYGPSRQMQGGDYTVNPDLTDYVNSVGQKVARVSDRKLPYEFVVLNNITPNAWALPGGKIAVNMGLLIELKSEAELAAVLGHEIVHAAAKHGAQSMQHGMLLQGALIATGIAMQGNDYANLVVGGAQVAAGLIHTKYGRDDELESDYYGMIYMSRAGYDPMAAIGLQETFVRLNKNRSPNWLAGLFASHPPSIERVEANRETAARLPKGGFIGKEVYNKKIATLAADRKGYESYAKGREALHKGEHDKAYGLAQEAIEVEPREGHFHALRGDIHLKEKKYEQALADYNQAIELNKNYFYYYLQRGLTQKKLNRNREAYADIQASTKLLPTAMAYNGLGELELAAGSNQRARQYFTEAASSDSPAGSAARLALLRLDFPQNAGKYIRIEAGLTRRGYVIARISNNAMLGIRDIELQIEYPDTAGKTRRTTRLLPGVIGAGKSFSASLDLGPYKDASVLNMLQIRIVNAHLVE